MPRGRFVSKTGSESFDYPVIIDKCGPYGLIFWQMLIPHLDVEGRFTGEPVLLKAAVAPLIEQITTHLIEETLPVLAELGMVVWYRVNGRRHIQCPNFEAHQIGLNKKREASSRHPEPNEDCEVFAGLLSPELLRNESGVALEQVVTRSGGGRDELAAKTRQVQDQDQDEDEDNALRSNSGVTPELEPLPWEVSSSSSSSSSFLKESHWASREDEAEQDGSITTPLQYEKYVASNGWNVPLSRAQSIMVENLLCVSPFTAHELDIATTQMAKRTDRPNAGYHLKLIDAQRARDEENVERKRRGTQATNRPEARVNAPTRADEERARENCRVPTDQEREEGLAALRAARAELEAKWGKGF